MTFNYQGIQNQAVVFVNPADMSHTFKVSQSASTRNKKSGYQTNRTEFLTNRVIDWARKKDCVDACSSTTEVESVRVSFSGSQENEADLIRRWEEIKANIDTAIAAGALRGLKPQYNAVFTVVADPTPESE